MTGGSNPFRPPDAELQDAAAGGGPMPAAVRLACTLVLVSLAIGVATLLPGVRPDEPGTEPVSPLATLLVVLVFGGVTVWLVRAVQRGRNWARWGLLGYLALGWWLGMDQLTASFAASPVVGLADVACILMEMVAAVLLFARAGRWFR